MIDLMRPSRIVSDVLPPPKQNKTLSQILLWLQLASGYQPALLNTTPILYNCR
jgi:hypothetical protein